MSKINIRRSKALVERYRNFTMYLDGEKLISIKNGETLTVDVLPGKHLLVAKIDWNTSNSIVFTIDEDEKKQFVVGTRSMFKSFYYTLAKPSMYLTLEEERPRQ